MTLRAGKGGRHRYLVGANRATKAVFACDVPRLRIEQVDELALGEVERRVLTPDRVKHLLPS